MEDTHLVAHVTLKLNQTRKTCLIHSNNILYYAFLLNIYEY